MAKMQMKMPDDFLKKITKLAERTDEISEKVLEAGGQVVLQKVKSNLTAVIGKDLKYSSRSTGELEDSLGLSGVKLDRRGDYNIKIGFAEPRKDRESNAKIANILEYGKPGQPAKPFLKPAKSASKAAAQDAMLKTFEEEVKKI